MIPALGVVADDLTGATDLAEQVWRAGRAATVLVGLPADGTDGRDGSDGTGGTDDGAGRPAGGEAAGCTVVALKNRSSDPEVAAHEAAQAVRALLARGARVVYQKYCSTFDSTPAGNIGPIGDAVAAVLAGRTGRAVRSVGTPATPSVGRTVRDGRLFVHGEPLERTSMAHHPRTPMTDSRLAELLRPQTRRPVALLTADTLRAGAPAVAAALAAAPRDAYVLCDAADEAELDVLAEALDAIVNEAPIGAAGRAPDVPVVALHGGAGLAGALARRDGVTRGPAPRARPTSARPGRRLVLSGSLSAATRAQHDAFTGPRVVVDGTCADTGGEARRVLDRLRAAYATTDGPVLVTSWDGREPGPVDADAADRTEEVLAAVAAGAVADLGAGAVLVAGGETSGAVVQALGVRELRLVRSVAPGLVWCAARRPGPPVELLLKSGNFGGPTLFDEAWEVTG